MEQSRFSEVSLEEGGGTSMAALRLARKSDVGLVGEAAVEVRPERKYRNG